MQIMGDVDRDAEIDVPLMPPDELVSFGQRIWWVHKRLSKALDPVKTRLREIALVRSNGSMEQQRLESADGSHAIVTPQPETMVLRKDANIEQVKIGLGAKFDDLFEKVTGYRPRKDIQSKIRMLTPTELTLVMSAVDMTDTKAKVEFKD
jgi:hypothetical protein